MTKLSDQISNLATFIMAEISDEPSASEGAVDCAIRIMREIRAENARLREALEKIRDHAHNCYDNGFEGQYGIGVADGHRCAAKIARAALASESAEGEE